MPIELFKMFKK